MIGTDIGPIVYEVAIEEIPETAFVDNWKGDTGSQEFNDWESDRLPRNLLDGDTYRPEPVVDAYGGGLNLIDGEF